MPTNDNSNVQAKLKRRIGLPLLVMYGTGITIGAGIYVLIGAVAGHAGKFAPWSFLLAALVMALTVASYAEMATRYPVSAGEAAYMRAAFSSKILSVLTGLLTLVIGVVSSAAVAIGSAGYMAQFIDLPAGVLIVIIVLVLGAISAWGILESVLLAALFTVIEVGGLLAIVASAVYAGLPVGPVILQVPPLDMASFSSIAFGGLLAFFAFIGFEDLANIAEEAQEPQRNLPRAMVWTLIVSTVLYVSIAVICVAAVPVEQLAASPAPLSLVFRTLAGVSPATISLIAIFATLNTILAQMTLSSRVMYGMARQGDLPEVLGRVDQRTATPLVATAINIALVIILAVALPLEKLAEGTSIATLAVFALVNISLITIRLRGIESGEPHVTVPLWMPVAGLLTSLAMMASAALG